MPIRDYCFEALGLRTMFATALSHNGPIMHYMLKSGWTLDKTLKNHAKSYSNEAMLDTCVFSLTRDAWVAWKKANLNNLKSDLPTVQGSSGDVTS